MRPAWVLRLMFAVICAACAASDIDAPADVGVASRLLNPEVIDAFFEPLIEAAEEKEAAQAAKVPGQEGEAAR